MATRKALSCLLLACLTSGPILACSDEEDDNPATAGTGDGDGDGDATPPAGDGDATPPAGDGDATPPAGDGDGTPPNPYNGVESDVADGTILPIVFVHGYVGSAQQYQSQAMRWEINGYPPELISAMDHDGAGLMTAQYAMQLEGFIDDVLAEHSEYDKVYLVGHSRGTTTSNIFLEKEENRAKVAKYIAIDGAPCPMTIACVAPTRAVFPGQAHVEVATSPESFALQYEFIMGEEPTTTEIVPEDGPVTLSGRVLVFPDNIGAEDATLRFWEIDETTGQRVASDPVDTFTIDATGNFGPVEVDPTKLYEAHLSRENGDTEQHIYMQRFLRSTNMMRLLTQDPTMSDIRENSNLGPDHAALIVMRMREWYEFDVLNITTETADGTTDAVDAINGMFGGDGASGLGAAIVAIHIFDDEATPKETTREEVPYFPAQPFQTGVDVYMPTTEAADGTITVTNYPRGDMDDPQTLVMPNWPSDKHSVTVFFNDYPQD